MTSGQFPDGIGARARLFELVRSHPQATDIQKTRVAICLDADMVRRRDTPTDALRALSALTAIGAPGEEAPVVRAEWYQVKAMAYDVLYNKGYKNQTDHELALRANDETLRLAQLSGFPADMAAFYIETRIGILQRAGKLEDVGQLRELTVRLETAVATLESGPVKDRAVALERFYSGCVDKLEGKYQDASGKFLRAYEVGPQPRYQVNGAAELVILCSQHPEAMQAFLPRLEELKVFVRTHLQQLDKGDKEKVEPYLSALD